MISRTLRGRAAARLLAAGFAAALAFSARAQSVSGQESPQDETTETAEPAQKADEVDVLKDIDVDKLDWSQLNTDESTAAARQAPKAPGTNRAAAGADATWSSKNNPNGSSAVTVKQSLSPFWDTRIGADMTVAREPATMSELLSEKVSNGGSLPQSSGTAWAAITAPGAGSLWDKTAVEARVDPGQEQSKLGTSLSKSLPLDEGYSITLRNGYNWIQQGVVPVPGIVQHPARSYETEQSAKLSITDTGTSFVAGQTLSSTDDKWLRKFGAEQKLSDDISISASVGETAQGTTNKSLTAGFKRSW